MYTVGVPKTTLTSDANCKWVSLRPPSGLIILQKDLQNSLKADSVTHSDSLVQQKDTD